MWMNQGKLKVLFGGAKSFSQLIRNVSDSNLVHLLTWSSQGSRVLTQQAEVSSLQ